MRCGPDASRHTVTSGMCVTEWVNGVARRWADASSDETSEVVVGRSSAPPYAQGRTRR